VKPPVVDQETATVPARIDPIAAFEWPSQPPIVEVLRRPVESARDYNEREATWSFCTRSRSQGQIRNRPTADAHF